MTFAARFAAAVARDPGRPFLTWYDDTSGERVELSYATTDNWVAKTANLLGEECGLAPGDEIAVLLPPHWQTVVVTLAAWLVGAQLAPAGEVTVLTEDDLPQHAGERGLVALSLRPMGRGLASSHPGVVDFAAEVPAFGDQYAGPPAPEPPELARADRLAAEWGLTPADRLLAAVPEWPGWLPAFVAGAGVVVHRDLDTVTSERLVTERVTSIVGDANHPGLRRLSPGG